MMKARMIMASQKVLPLMINQAIPTWRLLYKKVRRQRAKTHKRVHDTTRGKIEEPALKQSKAETECGNKGIGNAEAEDSTSTNCHQYSDSMEETIEQGQYGYLTETGFRRFSLDELKKFAVQVVAVFKLDESQQKSQSQSIPVIQNDVTTHSIPFAFEQQKASCSCNSRNSKTVMLPPMNTIGNMESVSSEGNNAGNNPDDPNKSCYKCGELGHFAWGCTNPRNREIQPKRKRVSRRRKKGSQVEATNVAT